MATSLERRFTPRIPLEGASWTYRAAATLRLKSGFPVLALQYFNSLQNKMKFLDRGRFFKVLKTWLIDAAFYLFDEWFKNSLVGLGREYCSTNLLPQQNSVSPCIISSSLILE